MIIRIRPIVIFNCLLMLGTMPAWSAELKLPGTVPGGSEFPADSDIDPINGHQIYVRLADGKRGSYGYPGSKRPVMLTAPINAGRYTVVYVAGNDTLATGEIEVTPVSASLSAPSSMIQMEDFDLQFSGPGNKQDKVEIRDPAGKPLRGLDYDYPRSKGPDKLILTAPEQPGSYTVVYLSQNTELARTAFEVIATTASLQAPASADMRETLTVGFSGPANKGDIIFIRGSDGKSLDYDYPKTTEGEVSLLAPEAPGSYQIIYRTGKETELAVLPLSVGATTASLQLPATVPAGSVAEITFSGPANSGDKIWIEVAPGKPGSYDYARDRKEGTLGLQVPEALGTYAVIYSSGKTELARSAFEVIDVTASLNAADTAEGALLFDVSWTGEGNRGDRINLVPAAGGKAVVWDYPVRGPVVQLRAPDEPGAYVLQYTTPSGRVLASRPIEILPPAQPPGYLRVDANNQLAFASGTAVEVVLDASGSMLQRLDGKRRIEIARQTLDHLVRNVIPAGTPFALRVFGHKEADACRTDLELPLAPLKPAEVAAKISSIQAMNLAKTPIAASLQAVARDLAGVNGDRIIILLTDGEETCEGDAAAVIAEMQKSGVKLTVNIVGFAIDDAALAMTFESWAALGGGQYVGANNATELETALSQAALQNFQVLDAAGKVLAEGKPGKMISLPPGDYQLKLGNGQHAIRIDSARTTVYRPE
jgi:hypothetical protein